MKPFVFRITFIFSFLLLQFSFLPAAFPSISFLPPVLLSLSVSWALLRGFSAMWPWAIVVGLLSDAVVFRTMGITALWMLVTLAGFSLVSKRFLYGHPFERIFIFGTATWVCGVCFHLFELFASQQQMTSGFFASVSVLFSFSSLFISWGVSLVFFGLILRVTQAFERYMELFERPSLGR